MSSSSTTFSDSRVSYEPGLRVAYQAVERRIADRAVIPIENSIGGSIYGNYSLLLRHNLHIVGNFCFLFLIACLPTMALSFTFENGSQPSPGCSQQRYSILVLAKEPLALPQMVPLSYFVYNTTSSLFPSNQIESRPLKNQPMQASMNNNKSIGYFHYIFYVDIEASMADQRTQTAITHLQSWGAIRWTQAGYMIDALTLIGV
ncbi:hypothetical protein F3Y22_tig00110882pilonHSYRG00146 [Hibiscus syriacus]|uniref:Prephenate dehydratase domain-containing protein n=1 Tax=Hibiscus syriacus TaxID=106335 RepID=A0A6A2ZIB2_HIBSY|nr:hypothetical protein F3Y22_tig00110882pilonHSYRG00146 [Hibiscus syriacus]